MREAQWHLLLENQMSYSSCGSHVPKSQLQSAKLLSNHSWATFNALWKFFRQETGLLPSMYIKQQKERLRPQRCP